MTSSILSTASRGLEFREDNRQATARITRWREVAALLQQGWHVEGFDVVSPAGERRSAWGNAIASCRARGLLDAPKAVGS